MGDESERVAASNADAREHVSSGGTTLGQVALGPMVDGGGVRAVDAAAVLFFQQTTGNSAVAAMLARQAQGVGEVVQEQAAEVAVEGEREASFARSGVPKLTAAGAELGQAAVSVKEPLGLGQAAVSAEHAVAVLDSVKSIVPHRPVPRLAKQYGDDSPAWDLDGAGLKISLAYEIVNTLKAPLGQTMAKVSFLFRSAASSLNEAAANAQSAEQSVVDHLTAVSSQLDTVGGMLTLLPPPDSAIDFARQNLNQAAGILERNRLKEPDPSIAPNAPDWVAYRAFSNAERRVGDAAEILGTLQHPDESRGSASRLFREAQAFVQRAVEKAR